jgi:hypothetical protein
MSTHDELCPRAYYDDPDTVVCLCPEFSAVRQDESVKTTARVRAQIAADIEAGCVHGRDTLLQPAGACCYRCAHAARVARGDA